MRRSGPSLYLPAAGLLIDTPEESNGQLTNHNLAPRHVAWTHAHPDHAAGMRVVQFLAQSTGRAVLGIVPAPLHPVLAARYQLDYLVNAGYLELRLLPPGRAVEIGDVRLTALAHQMEEPVFAYVFERAGARGLYAPDHFRFLPTPAGHFDWAVVQMPIPSLNFLPFELPPEHEAWRNFYTFEDVTRIWRGKTDRLVFTHIYESVGMTPEELDTVAASAGDWVEFAYDGMEVASKKDGGSKEDRLRLFKAEQRRIERQFAKDPKRMRAELRLLWARHKEAD